MELCVEVGSPASLYVVGIVSQALAGGGGGGRGSGFTMPRVRHRQRLAEHCRQMPAGRFRLPTAAPASASSAMVEEEVYRVNGTYLKRCLAAGRRPGSAIHTA